MSERARAASMKLWLKNRANPYPCPDCGKTINKTTASRHNKSMYHRLEVLTKIIEMPQVTEDSTVQ